MPAVRGREGVDDRCVARHHRGMDEPTVHRLSAFTDDPAGGNPAGVVVTDAPLDPADAQRIAAEVGYSETAFLSPLDEGDAYRVRFFAPAAEVPFCGHATIASGVLLGRTRGAGTYRFATAAGEVVVAVSAGDGRVEATLTSVPPRVTVPPDGLVEEVLTTLGWTPEVLDPDLGPALAYAGAWHLLLPLRDRETLGEVDYAFDALREIMAGQDLTTVALLWREAPTTFHARNLFPPGGVVEDPATGAAAAALGAYLRAHGHVAAPATVEVLQGVDMGRPSRIRVDVPDGAGGIAVTGTAVAIDA
jgi:PhzF family phenazine biosynthesis protein